MLQFSIRELLLVTVIVGLSVSWWMDRSRLVELATKSASEAEVTDMKLYALESAATEAGLRILWLWDGKRVQVEKFAGSWNYPADVPRPKPSESE